MSHPMDRLIELDNCDITEAMKEYPGLSPEELCPHRARDKYVLLNGEVQYSCRTCGYSWIGHDSKYDR